MHSDGHESMYTTDDDTGSSQFSGIGPPLIFFVTLILFCYAMSKTTNITEDENLADPPEKARAGGPDGPSVDTFLSRLGSGQKSTVAPWSVQRTFHGEDVSEHSGAVSEEEKLSLKDIGDAAKSVFSRASRLVTDGGTPIAHGSSVEHGKSKVVRVRSTADGNTYMVAADLPDKNVAADKLAEVHRRSQYLLQSISEQLEEGGRIQAEDKVDITDNMKQLVRKHYKKFTPLSEYHNVHDHTVGANSSKGEMIETCLRDKYDTSKWNSDNTLLRVHIHELAHSADFHYRADGDDGHGPVFKRLHKFLLGVAQNLGIYDCDEYQRSGRRFCGLRLTEDFCGETNPVTKIEK